jgi:hypothetical protein
MEGAPREVYDPSSQQINTCDVLFRDGGKKKLDVFFPARKAVDVRVVAGACKTLPGPLVGGILNEGLIV